MVWESFTKVSSVVRVQESIQGGRIKQEQAYMVSTKKSTEHEIDVMQTYFDRKKGT